MLSMAATPLHCQALLNDSGWHMPRKAITKSVADADPAPGGAAAVDRAASLLAAFNRGDTSLSLAELALRTRLYKSTVLRLLTSLGHAGLIQRLDDGNYTLGPEVARLHGIYAASFSLDKVVMPVLRVLVAETGESAAYHVIQGQARLCLYRVDSPHPIRDHVRAGDLLPLDKGTGARVLVAFDDRFRGTLGRKNKTLYDRIRKEGYYANTGDRQAEVAGISVPVFRFDRTVAAALTLTMPAHRYHERYLVPTLEAARQLERVIA